MEVFTVPVEDKYIIYRPLRRLAFVGNQAMAEMVQQLAHRIAPQADTAAAAAEMEAPDDARSFLHDIGFLDPDFPLPAAPDHTFQPTVAVLLLTNRCHLRCVYCYANAGVALGQDLNWDLAKAAIDYACENAIRLEHPQFTLSLHGGGEPVMAWSLIKQATAYARAKPLPCTISLTSNGVWSERQAHWIIEHLDNVSLSVDGAPHTQDSQRPFLSGAGSSPVVIRTIGLLDAADFAYGIRMTATPPFRHKLPEDVQFLCRKTECKGFQVEPAFNIVRGGHDSPDLDQAKGFIEGFKTAYEIATQANRRLTYSGARPWHLTQAFCNAPYTALAVNPSGRLVSCFEVTDDGHPLAALSTVGRIVQEQVMIDQEVREELLSRIDARRAQCSQCFCRWHCAGDCYARSFGQDGDYLQFSVRCTINRALTAYLLMWSIMEGDGVWQGQNGRPVPSGISSVQVPSPRMDKEPVLLQYLEEFQ